MISIFFFSKCHLFHNATLFGFCITHILNTGCAKFEKKKSVAERLIMFGTEKGNKVVCTVYVSIVVTCGMQWGDNQFESEFEG